jgi:hypothetical protein
VWEWGADFCPCSRGVFQYDVEVLMMGGKREVGLEGLETWCGWFSLRRKTYPGQSILMADVTFEECSLEGRGVEAAVQFFQGSKWLRKRLWLA